MFYCTFQSGFWGQELPGGTWLALQLWADCGDGFPPCQQELGSLSALQHCLGCFLVFVFGELTEVLLEGFFASRHSKLNFVPFFLETLALFSQLPA